MVISLVDVAGQWLDGEQRASAVADGDAVVAAEGVDLEPVGRVAAGDAGLSREPGHLDRAAVRRHVDPVGLVGAVHQDGVVLGIGSAGGGGQVDVRRRDVGTAEVADRHGVHAPEGREVQALHAVEVHPDVPEVAEEDRARAVGRQGHQLVAVGAVEHQGVPAEAADDRVVAVAGVPGRGVVAVPEHLDVGADAPVDEVDPVAADQDVTPGSGGRDVVAVAARDRGRYVDEDTTGDRPELVVARPQVHRRRVEAARREPPGAVAATEVHDDRVERGEVEGDLVGGVGAADDEDVAHDDRSGLRRRRLGLSSGERGARDEGGGGGCGRGPPVSLHSHGLLFLVPGRPVPTSALLRRLLDGGSLGTDPRRPA